MMTSLYISVKPEEPARIKNGVAEGLAHVESAWASMGRPLEEVVEQFVDAKVLLLCSSDYDDVLDFA